MTAMPKTTPKKNKPTAREIRTAALREALAALPKRMNRATVNFDGGWNSAVEAARKKITSLML